VTRQLFDNSDGRGINRGEALSEFGESGMLDPRRKVTQNVVENSDLLIVETIGILQKKVGHAPQGRYPVLWRTGSDGAFQLIDQ